MSEHVHDAGCPVAGWEKRALEHLAGVIQTAMTESWDPCTEYDDAPIAVARAVWAELVDTPIATGEHPARDLAAYYAVSGIGQQIIGEDPPPGVVAVVPRQHLVSFVVTNLDRLRLVNATPEELAAPH